MSDELLRAQKRRVALAPDDGSARAELGATLLQAGLAAEACVQLVRALELDPGLAAARRALARAYVAELRPTLAESTLSDALRRQPDDQHARTDLAELLERAGREPEALLQREVLSRKAPTDRSNLVQALTLATALGYTQLALRLARALHALTGDEASQRAVLELGLELGQLDVVTATALVPCSAELRLARLREALSRPPLDAVVATAELRDVASAIRAQDLKRARRLLALLTEPSGSADCLRAELLHVSAQLEGAEAAYHAALGKRLSPSLQAGACRGLAELELARGRVEGASAWLERARQQLPEDPELTEQLADLRLASGDRGAAQALYELATRSLGSASAHAKLSALRTAAHGHEATPCGRIASLAFTGRGGVATPVEVLVLPGRGDVRVTGNVGKVGTESAQVAVQCVRARAAELGLPAAASDVHVHFADLNALRDGPSAGITIALALVSALRKVALPATLAATGELSLQGRVLAVAGLREKLVAAFLSGHTRVIAPRATLFDIRELPDELARGLRITFVDTLSEAVSAAFG